MLPLTHFVALLALLFDFNSFVYLQTSCVPFVFYESLFRPSDMSNRRYGHHSIFLNDSHPPEYGSILSAIALDFTAALASASLERYLTFPLLPLLSSTPPGPVIGP